MEPIRKDVFAEDMRLKNPSLKYWDDDRILNYVHDNFPEVASSIEWLDPPSEPSWVEKSSAPWLEMKTGCLRTGNLLRHLLQMHIV